MVHALQNHSPEEALMKAVVFHGVGDIRLDEVADPERKEATDALVRLTASAICGTDLHFVRGTMPGVRPGTILGHEGVGVVEEAGAAVRSFRPGDRVVIGSTINCGYCSYCRAGHHAQCDVANPNAPGTAFFGGPEMAGGFHGLQAERARIPHATSTMVKLPDEVSDDQAILLSDIFPTGYFGADMADIKPGSTVAVFGCGPVGLFTIASAILLGAGRVFAVDRHEDRLARAVALGAEAVNFSKEDPVAVLKELTGGIGPDRVIDAVGVEAELPGQKEQPEQLDEMMKERARGSSFQPGGAPTAAIDWAVDAVAKAGVISVIGVYPESVRWFPFGKAMMKNLRIHTGNCHHRRYLPKLIELVRTGAVDPLKILSQVEPMTSAIDAYRAFDERRAGWIKVELKPSR
jgi:threonine dehydrogenase-like Zn-dependent dehydrogenase